VSFFIPVFALLVSLAVPGRGETPKVGLVVNGSFNDRGGVHNVDELRKASWKCPDAADWPRR